MVKRKGLESILLQMVLSLKASFNKINPLERALIDILIKRSIKDFGNKEKNTERVFLFKMDVKKRDFGIMGSLSNG